MLSTLYIHSQYADSENGAGARIDKPTSRRVLLVGNRSAVKAETHRMRRYASSYRKMNERELAKLAEYQDEDAIHYEDLDLSELLKEYDEDAKNFKEKYGEYYDDIKFKEKDWW